MFLRVIIPGLIAVIPVEIDGVGTTNSFRWTRDGGLTWTDEKVLMKAGGQHLEDGIFIQFNHLEGHQLGDSWTIQAEPGFVVVSLIDTPSDAVDATLARNAFQRAIEEQRSLDLLSMVGSTAGTDHNLTLQHAMDVSMSNQFNFAQLDPSGTAVYDQGGPLKWTRVEDGFIKPQATGSTLDQPFGMTWAPRVEGNYLVYAVVEDNAGNRVTSDFAIIYATKKVGKLLYR